MRKDTSTRLRTALDLLSKTGVTRLQHAPPAYQLLWRLGVSIPPPHFMSFRSLLLFQGTAVFVAAAVLFMPARAFLFPEMPMLVLLALILLAAALFGFFMARYFTAEARHLGLPSWQELSSTATVSSERASDRGGKRRLLANRK
jgi:hypothetical protein